MRSTRIGPRAGSLAAREAGARTKNHMQISSSYDTHESRRSTDDADARSQYIRYSYSVSEFGVSNSNLPIILGSCMDHTRLTNRTVRIWP